MTGQHPDSLDRLILNAVQSDFPAAARPYEALAARLNVTFGLNLTESEVLERVTALRRDGFIRRLGAVFDARALGYRSTLCAARVPEDRLAVFRRLTDAAPQITHNYLRPGRLNAWFTFTSGRREELDEFLERLRGAGSLKEIHVLDAERIFKIKVNFVIPEVKDDDL